MSAFLSVLLQLNDLRDKQLAVESLNAQLREIEPRLDAARKKMEFIRYADRSPDRRHFVFDLIDELGKLTPDGIVFKSLDFEDGGRLMIRGYSRTNSEINDFQSRLIRTPGFHDVDLNFATKRFTGKQSVVDFKLTSHWSGLEEQGT